MNSLSRLLWLYRRLNAMGPAEIAFRVREQGRRFAWRTYARGLLAVFGNGSGPVPAFDLGLLAAKGSLYVTRPTLNTYAARREDLEAGAKELFDVVKSGKVKIEVNQTYALKDAAQAHRDLEGRKTTGSTVLLP